MSNSKVLIIGSAAVDLIIQLERLPKPGETIVGGTFAFAYGGKGANQAVGAARLGAEITFVANIGKDDYGDQCISNFVDEGINVDFIDRDADHATAVAFIFVDENGENAIGVASGANMEMSKSTVDAAQSVIVDHKVMLLQLESPMETVRYAAKLGSEAGLPVILNPAPAFPLDSDMLNLIDIITPNETEAEILTGISVTDEDTAKEAAKKLKETGVSNVIITLGAAGAYLLSDTKSMLIPSKKVDSVDTTAAGDAFNGALAYAVAKGEEMEAAVHFANMAGAFAATKLGAQASMPTAAEYAAFVR
jgi:ribokinase